MNAEDYKEIADDLREVCWDIEDCRDTNDFFNEKKKDELDRIYRQCQAFITEYKTYKKFVNHRYKIDWEKVVFNLNYIRNELIHFSGSIEFLCNNKLMGHNLDLINKQFDLNIDCICITIKEVEEHKFDIVGMIEVYNNEGQHIDNYSMEEIKHNYKKYRKYKTSKMLENL